MIHEGIWDFCGEKFKEFPSIWLLARLENRRNYLEDGGRRKQLKAFPFSLCGSKAN